jgi:hypothetical protein
MKRVEFVLVMDHIFAEHRFDHSPIKQVLRRLRSTAFCKRQLHQRARILKKNVITKVNLNAIGIRMMRQ